MDPFLTMFYIIQELSIAYYQVSFYANNFFRAITNSAQCL